MIRYPLLSDVWEQQSSYNKKIKSVQSHSEADWMINYIVGAMSELGEILRETNWKTHRVKTSEEFGPNMAEELADLTKYVFSMWQLIGYKPEDMLRELLLKGEVLDKIFSQEMKNPPGGKYIIILDLDGVVVNFRDGFRKWLATSHWKFLLNLSQEEFSNIGIHLDIDEGWNYASYKEAKTAFEKTQGYRNLPSISEIVKAVHWLQGEGFYIIATTSRPYREYKKIWSDTWSWLISHKLQVDELHFDGEGRIPRAVKHSTWNVVMALEDNPVLAKRYAASKIKVFLVDQVYNQDVKDDEFITRIYPGDSLWNTARTICEFCKIASPE